MISRISSMAIAEAYYMKFSFTRRNPNPSQSKSVVSKDELYDFLYVNNFDSWLLNLVKGLSSYNRRQFKEFFMRFHTGESVASATPNWDWQQRQKFGQQILIELARSIITTRLNDPTFGGYKDQYNKPVDEMRTQLELDGYIYKDGILLFPDESVLDVEEEQSLLNNLYGQLGLKNRKTMVHHLDLSVEHYKNQKWDDSISNSRKVLELVLQEIAIAHSNNTPTPISKNQSERPVFIRDYLEQEGLIEQKEKEVFAKIYGLLSNTGGHPYIARNDQARLLRHYALTTCQFVLLRYQGSLNSTST